jgi:hypothetical protein
MQISMVEVSIAKLESSMMKMLKSLISSRYLKMIVSIILLKQLTTNGAD